MSAGGGAGRSMAIRAAVPEDCAGIAKLHAQSFPQGWDATSFPRFLADPACITLVAGRIGDLAGFILARSAADEADIVTLAVAPHARCKGVGRLLVEALADALRGRGVQALFLEVGEENHAAVSLYSRAGFREAGRRAGYYAAQGRAPSRDALLLRLDLS